MAWQVAVWEPGATTRIGLRASFASAAIVILLGVFQVQGWTMPKGLAIPLIVLLVAMIVIAISMIVYDVVAAFRRYLRHRATSASWVSKEKPGLLDYEADGIAASEFFVEKLTELSSSTQRLGARLERHTEAFERSKGKSANERQKVANRAAKEIDKSAVVIEDRLELLHELVKDILRNAEGLIGSVDLSTPDDLESAKDFRSILTETNQATTGTLESIRGYRKTVREQEQMNLSRTIRIADGRLARALEGVEKVLRKHSTGSVQLVRSLDRKIADAEREAARAVNPP
jgi:hypothetical protein